MSVKIEIFKKNGDVLERPTKAVDTLEQGRLEAKRVIKLHAPTCNAVMHWSESMDGTTCYGSTFDKRFSAIVREVSDE